MTVIEAEGLTKSYRNVNALDKLTFTIEENSITGLIGRNGAGKTTLLKTIAGFIKVSEGRINVFGENPFNSLKVSANTFYADDNLVFPPSLILKEISEQISKFYANWDSNLSEGLFNYFRLNLKQKHEKLSKGQKSTFNAILALASHSALTIFDEPTTGMDSAVRKDFYRALLKDYIAYPRTIIISSHLLSEIEDILENILLINEGSKVLHMQVDELREMAVKVKGEANLVNTFLKEKEIIHEETAGSNFRSAVVKNTLSETELQNAKMAGLEIVPVNADDLCVYLTAKVKGGIDDVFNRN